MFSRDVKKGPNDGRHPKDCMERSRRKSGYTAATTDTVRRSSSPKESESSNRTLMHSAQQCAVKVTLQSEVGNEHNHIQIAGEPALRSAFEGRPPGSRKVGWKR